jgi:hypothetical protein
MNLYIFVLDLFDTKLTEFYPSFDFFSKVEAGAAKKSFYKFVAKLWLLLCSAKVQICHKKSKLIKKGWAFKRK